MSSIKCSHRLGLLKSRMKEKGNEQVGHESSLELEVMLRGEGEVLVGEVKLNMELSWGNLLRAKRPWGWGILVTSTVTMMVLGETVRHQRNGWYL